MPKKKKPSNSFASKKKTTNKGNSSKGVGGPAGSYLTNKKSKRNRLDRAGSLPKKKGK